MLFFQQKLCSFFVSPKFVTIVTGQGGALAFTNAKINIFQMLTSDFQKSLTYSGTTGHQRKFGLNTETFIMFRGVPAFDFLNHITGDIIRAINRKMTNGDKTIRPNRHTSIKNLAL